jgi:hypothetical protein
MFPAKFFLYLSFWFFCLCVTAKNTAWKDELLSLVAATNSSYLCYYFRSKLSHQKKQSREDRAVQLNSILRECELHNVTLSNPSVSKLATPHQKSEGHIVMYTHNGFGNQLYQLAFGYLVAASMRRELHIADTMPGQFLLIYI